MTAPLLPPTPPNPSQHPEKAITLALRLACAENALETFTAGQVDAIVDVNGRAYLLRSAQEHLRQSERKLQDMIACAVDVVTVVNRGGSIVSQSPSVKRVLGFGTNELVGMSFFDFVNSEDVPQLYSAFLNVIEKFRTDATVKFRHRTHDGAYRLVEATVGRLSYFSPPCVILSMRPVTTISELFTEAAPAQADPLPTGPNEGFSIGKL